MTVGELIEELRMYRPEIRVTLTVCEHEPADPESKNVTRANIYGIVTQSPDEIRLR